MPYITMQQSPAFKQAQANALQDTIEQVHDKLVQQFGLPDDQDTHLMVSDILKALAVNGKCATN